jgi:hypothetical protein
MSKCEETISSVQGIQFELELKDPEKDCEVDSEGRQHKITIKNLRPNSVRVKPESESIDQHVVFGNPGTYTWSDSVTVSKRRKTSTVKQCSETAYSDEPGNGDILESEIRYKDIFPWKPSLSSVSDDIEVDVC